MTDDKSLSYKEAGVDVEAGYKTVSLIKSHIQKTFTQGVLTDIGGFGSLFSIDKNAYDEPVLVSGTDGVGTKLKLAFMMDKHDTIGEDCVAMCVNDILCQGAKPLFFLDYFATGKLSPEKAAEVIKGIANGCIKAGAALVGGETAEMPGFYQKDEYDLAGFAVGIVDRKHIINGSSIKENDVLIGLASSGLHSNGYSLAREVFFNREKLSPQSYLEETRSTIGEELIKPTRIYVNTILDLLKKFDIKGMSHITGGGFNENIPRMMPAGLSAKVTTAVIEKQAIFDVIQRMGHIKTEEMYHTFNMGVGFVFVVRPDASATILKYLKEKGEQAFLMGEVIKGNHKIELCHP